MNKQCKTISEFLKGTTYYRFDALVLHDNKSSKKDDNTILFTLAYDDMEGVKQVNETKKDPLLFEIGELFNSENEEDDEKANKLFDENLEYIQKKMLEIEEKVSIGTKLQEICKELFPNELTYLDTSIRKVKFYFNDHVSDYRKKEIIQILRKLEYFPRTFLVEKHDYDTVEKYIENYIHDHLANNPKNVRVYWQFSMKYLKFVFKIPNSTKFNVMEFVLNDDSKYDSEINLKTHDVFNDILTNTFKDISNKYGNDCEYQISEESTAFIFKDLNSIDSTKFNEILKEFEQVAYNYIRSNQTIIDNFGDLNKNLKVNNAIIDFIEIHDLIDVARYFNTFVND